MEDHLTTDFGAACFLVDLSNVVRNRTLGEPGLRSLRRLRLLVDAAKRLARDPDVKLYLVADASLRLGGRREFTDPADIRLLGRWVDRGLVEELPDADDRLLELCAYTGIPVITGDRFRGHRESHPWIQGNADDFLEPDVVNRNWRCAERRCTLYDTHKGSAALLPRVIGGVPHCQSHGTPLADDGPRTATVQLKLLVEGDVKARFTLEDGTTVKVGRAPGEGGISLHDLVPEHRTAGLSRAHVELRVTGGVVHVRDHSTYGTRWRSTAGKSGPGPWRKLGTAERQYHGGDELRLVEGVILARSGRRFPTELAQQWQRRRPLPPDTAGETRMY